MTTIQVPFNLPETITFKHGGETVGVKTADIPESMLVMLFQYGVTRKANDTLNGEAKKVRDEGGEWIAKDNLVAWTEELLEGKIGTGSRATDTVEKHSRRIVSGLLVKHLQLSKKDAAEAVRKGAKVVYDEHFKDSDPQVWVKIESNARAAAKIEEDAKAALADLDVEI